MKLKIAKTGGGATLLARIDGYFVRFDGSVFSCFNAGRLNRKGFTLAEMLVVMLILTIVLAAFAPLMTKRKTVDLTSPWRYAANNSDAYYGLFNTQTAMIGQNAKATNEKDSRLIINTSSANQSHILFKQSGNLKGHLRLTTDSLMLGAYNTSSSASSSNNMTIGIDAFGSNSGMYNTVLGNQSLRYGSGSNYNTTVGYGAGYAGGMYNSLLGYKAGYNGGSYNTVIGYNAANKNSGASNTIVGSSSFTKNTSGSYNTVVGVSSLDAATSGDGNTSIGYNTFGFLNFGSYNTAIGVNACSRVTGSNKICIGYGAGPNSTSSSVSSDAQERIFIGRSSTINPYNGSAVLEVHNTSQNPTVVVNANLLVNGVIFGNSEIIAGYRLYADGSGPNGAFRHAEEKGGDVRNLSEFPWISQYSVRWSDKRLKNILGDNDFGLEQIRQLEVYNYNFKADKNKKMQVGVIAQDLQKVFPDAVMKDDNGYLKIRWDDMFYAVINAIKELDKTIQQIVEDVKTAMERLNSHDKEIKKLQQENEELKARIEKLEKLVK